jgi:hypothetical protein
MYLGNSPTYVTRTDFVYVVAVDGQTVFTGVDSNGLVLSYNVNNFDVFANGLLLPRSDFGTATGASITLSQARLAGDVITVRAYGFPSTLNALLPAKVDVATAGVYSPYRNKIINGGFEIAQRGTSNTTSGYCADDRWFNGNNGTTKVSSVGVHTVGLNSIPGNPIYYSSTVVTSVAGANNNCYKQQKIENVQTLQGETATLTFYAYGTVGVKIAVEFVQNFGTGGSPSASVQGIGVTQVTLAASPVRYDVVVNIPSIAGKVLGTNDDDNLSVLFWFDAGSNYNSRTNNLGQQSGAFTLSHVSLVEGDARAENDPFSPRHLQQELALCQRYYTAFNASQSGYTTAGASIATQLVWPVTMRAIPTVTNIGGTNTNAGSSTVDNPSTYGARWLVTATATGPVGIGARSITADAEL